MSQLWTTSVVDFRMKNIPEIDEDKCLLGNYFALQKTTKYKQLITGHHLLKENVIVVFDDNQDKTETIKKIKQAFPTKIFTNLTAASLLSLFPEMKKKTNSSLFISKSNWSNVLKNLYIGDALFALNDDYINTFQIRAVINLAPDCCANKHEAESEFSYYTIYEYDTEDTTLRPYFHSTNRFIDKHISSGGVLVHCAAGVSRSSTIIIAYLMYKLNISLEKAYEFLQKRHPSACPNPQFYYDLLNFQEEIFS